MSRINGPADRPIAPKEQMSETEQTSETSSIQKTEIEAKTRLDAGQTENEQAPPADTKGQVSEHIMDGKSRQAELQLKLPIPSPPTRNEFPDERSDLDPNVHLDEKIDVTKNLPDGHAINSGLKGLDWGSSKEKTGPNHMGVDLTYGGMKAPTDRIAEVVNAGKPSQPDISAPKGDGNHSGKSMIRNADEKVSGGGQNSNSGISDGKGGSQGTPPPGIELGFRAPKGDLVGQATAGEYQTIFGPGPKTPTQTGDADKQTARNEAAMKGNEPSEKTKQAQEAWKKKTGTDGGTMVDPDAAGGTGFVPTSDEIAKIMKGRLGQVEHGINPDLGVGGGPTGELKKPIDLLSDPTDDGKSSLETSTPKKAKLIADIHGPRTVNPDSGFGPIQPEGGIKGGGNSGGGDPSDQGA